MERKCNCHGVSGSCAIKTCWNELPNIAVIASTLQKKYKKAVKVKVKPGEPDEMRLNLSEEDNNETPKLDALVYQSDSPNYCSGSKNAFYLGTVGRACNATSVGYDGCNHLCCGRGFARVQYQEKFSCRCEFQWCCKVACQTCFRQRVVHVCN